VNNILVSGASGIVGYGVLKSLRKAGRSLNLIGSSIYEESIANGFCDKFVLAPHTNDPGYLDWLRRTIISEKIDLIVPGIEIDLYKWAEHRAEIEAAGTKIVINQPDLVELSKDKWSFFEVLQGSAPSFAIPSRITGTFAELKAEFGLPFLMKPRRGFGGRGIVRVVDEATFDKSKSELGNVLMAQPIVGSDDEEYTTSAFGDGKGTLTACMTLRRKLSKEGFTGNAHVSDSAPFMPALSSLSEIFKPLGPTNFQFRKVGIDVKLLEINPRISSSTSIRTAFGYNESAMSVDFYLDGVLPAQPKIQRGRAIRYVEDYIFYENSVHS